MSDPVTLWHVYNDGDHYAAPYMTTVPEGAPMPESFDEWKALPTEDFERMASDARALRWLIDASKHPGNSALRKAMEDLGVSEPAGPAVKMMFFQSGLTHPTHTRKAK